MTTEGNAPTATEAHAGATTSVDEPEANPRDQLRSDLRFTVVVFLGIMLIVAGANGGYQIWHSAGKGTEDRAALSSELFGTAQGPGAANWVAPFEVLSVLLLAALIAAIVLAIREGSD